MAKKPAEKAKTDEKQIDAALKADAKKKAEETHEKTEHAYDWMLTSILSLSGFALAASAFYGWHYSVKGMILAALASCVGYTIGGISGFLFGFPRYTESTSVSSAADLPTANSGSTSRVTPALRHNTNLERITDWLMTMIIGATLVNLQELVAWSEAQFRAITAAIVYSGQTDFPDSLDIYAAPGAVLVLPFMAAGFLHMYMWARKYLLPEWLALDKALQTDVAKLEEKQQTQQEVIARLSAAQYGVDPTYLNRQQQTLERLGLDGDTTDAIVERYKAAESWDDDPLKDFGPSEADGFRLSAKVTLDPNNKNNPYRVDIIVERTDGASFRGSIVLLLHNSFRSPIIIEPVFSGTQYTETISAADSFCLGALVVPEESESGTRLSLDLGALPDVPKGFVSDSPKG